MFMRENTVFRKSKNKNENKMEGGGRGLVPYSQGFGGNGAGGPAGRQATAGGSRGVAPAGVQVNLGMFMREDTIFVSQK